MTRKDYEAIAGAILATRRDDEYDNSTPTNSYNEALYDVALKIADIIMSVDNPRFDRAKFLKACGI